METNALFVDQEHMWNLGLTLLLRRRKCSGLRAAHLTRIIKAWEKQIGVKDLYEKALDTASETEQL